MNVRIVHLKPQITGLLPSIKRLAQFSQLACNNLIWRRKDTLCNKILSFDNS